MLLGKAAARSDHRSRHFGIGQNITLNLWWRQIGISRLPHPWEHRQPSRHATVLLGYLPVPTLSCCSSATQQRKGYEVFHACMSHLLEPMIEAGDNGVSILCSDGRKRHVFPLLAAYCADHPEQCVVACSLENRCPKGTIGRDE